MADFTLDYAGNRWYDTEPIHHENIVIDGRFELGEWYECPLCGTDVSFAPGGDRHTDGFAPEAFPDSARCSNCDYQWSE